MSLLIIFPEKKFYSKKIKKIGNAFDFRNAVTRQNLIGRAVISLTKLITVAGINKPQFLSLKLEHPTENDERGTIKVRIEFEPTGFVASEEEEKAEES